MWWNKITAILNICSVLIWTNSTQYLFQRICGFWFCVPSFQIVTQMLGFFFSLYTALIVLCCNIISVIVFVLFWFEQILHNIYFNEFTNFDFVFSLFNCDTNAWVFFSLITQLLTLLWRNRIAAISFVLFWLEQLSHIYFNKFADFLFFPFSIVTQMGFFSLS